MQLRKHSPDHQQPYLRNQHGDISHQDAQSDPLSVQLQQLITEWELRLKRKKPDKNRTVIQPSETTYMILNHVLQIRQPSVMTRSRQTGQDEVEYLETEEW